MSRERSDFDTPWKDILDIYFKDFMALCWPDKYRDIDWEKGYTMLDKELSRISKNATVGNRVLDKLIQVYRKNGEKTCVLLHIEIQGRPNVHFPKRMFVYRYRLHDLYEMPVASLAILMDEDEHWRPQVYRSELWGSYIEMRFVIIKLTDYRSNILELEQSTNPFAMVILAQLAAMKSKDPMSKLIAKINLSRRLLNKKWNKKDISHLFHFIDWILALTPVLELEYKEAIKQIIGEEQEDMRKYFCKVKYVSSIERFGIQKGLEQGLERGLVQGVQQGQSTLLLDQLQYKFHDVPEVYRQQVEQADPNTLTRWGKKILESQNLEEVFLV